MAKRHNVTAWRITLEDDELGNQIEQHVAEIMTDVFLEGEAQAKGYLRPGRGVDTGTMQNRTHVAQGGHDWPAEHFDPVPGGGPELGGQRVAPNRVPSGRAFGRLVLELGCGQDYAVHFHQRVFPFLRRAWEFANQRLLQEIDGRASSL